MPRHGAHVAAPLVGHRAARRWPMRTGPAGRRSSPRCRLPGSRRWPVNRRTGAGCRCRGGRARVGLRTRCRHRRVDLSVHDAAGGCPRTRSSPGSTGPGSSPATRTSPPKPAGCSTSTPAPSTANRSVPTSTSSPPTRRPASRPAAAATPPWHQESPAGCGSTTNTTAAARWPTWPPTTHRAQVFGRCEDTTGIDPFTALVEQVMTQEPYASAEPGVLDRRQRLLPPRPSLDRPPRETVPERGHDPHPRPRLLAEPDRDLLLDRPTQSRHTPTTSPTSTRSKTDSPPSNGATTRPPGPSDGSSPRPTSPTYYRSDYEQAHPGRTTSRLDYPRRTYGADHLAMWGSQSITGDIRERDGAPRPWGLPIRADLRARSKLVLDPQRSAQEIGVLHAQREQLADS